MCNMKKITPLTKSNHLFICASVNSNYPSAKTSYERFQTRATGAEIA